VLPLTREIGDERSLMFILRQAGNFLIEDPLQARPYLEESLELARKLGDLSGEAAALNSIANMHQHQGEWAQARPAYEAAVRAGQAGADPFIEEIARENLGTNFVWEGRYDEARAELEAARSLAQNWASNSTPPARTRTWGSWPSTRETPPPPMPPWKRRCALTASRARRHRRCSCCSRSARRSAGTIAAP